MKEAILKLRSEGKSYDEIKKTLKCSKGTISYHCGEGQKEKNRNRCRKNRLNKSEIIKRKIDTFVRNKVRNFKREGQLGTVGRGKTTSTFDYKAAFDLIDKAKVCYLSGRSIDIEKRYSYNLDHKIPVSKGGKNTLINMGVCTKEVNQAKNDLCVEDFIKLCIDVCEYNGYTVINKRP